MADLVLQTAPLGFQWPTIDPFLFCVHHDDAYPAGNEVMGPDTPLTGRPIGQDFEGVDGWRMYHGTTVPGFPQHPHRGFETVTYVRQGIIDHSDSLGAAARFGRGDVQWLTAGKGIVHSEMFPLLDPDGPNPLELFQIWLNLPAADKLVDPYFTMLWDTDIPKHRIVDDDGAATEVTTIAGAYAGAETPAPPPDSWAGRADAEVAIWHLSFEPGARFTLPPTSDQAVRALYVFDGPGVSVAHQRIADSTVGVLAPGPAIDLVAADATTDALLLQGRPIAEPVEQYGPFVMNTRAEIDQAFADYRRTQFGGWPFADDDPVHGREHGRFARHADGRTAVPTD